MFVRRFPVRTWIFQLRGMDEEKEEGADSGGVRINTVRPLTQRLNF